MVCFVARSFLFLAVLAASSAVVVSAEEPTAAEPTAAEKLFALKVRPLLEDKCLGCHGRDPDKIESGFDMRTRAGLLAGGDLFGEEAFLPGKAAESAVMEMLKRTDPDYAMPPKEAERLTETEVWWVRDWINGGAPWPDEDRVAEIYKRFASGVVVSTSGGLSDEWTNRKYESKNLWAYQPIQRVEVPDGEHPIDFFIAKALARRGLEPAPLAGRRTLLRRAAFDLLGLPPTLKQQDRFLADPRSDEEAFAALVERLLASSHYGEQWGRHWLDVVRYADSSGFANDWERPNAWRYRDYVVRAFNSDKPYDQFVREQVAGDELDAGSPEHLVAVGFLRMGPWEHTAMSVAKVTRQQFLDDVTDAVGQVFLGHALQCCRCHDHKFDPVPTRDYYSIQAVFGTTQFAEVDAAWIDGENLAGMESDRRRLERQAAANGKIMAAVGARKRESQAAWLKAKGLPYKTLAEARKAGVADLPSLNELKTPDDFGQERIARKWSTRFSWELDRYRPIAFSVYSGATGPRLAQARLRKPKNAQAKRKPPVTHILTGGDVFAAGQAVEPGVLSALPNGNFEIPPSVTGRRAAFAAWLTDEDNTLTARVMVNRIWQYHFGRGLAGNPNNFGATGKKPTHPELLDWLASEFMRRNWSVKHVHRLIMSSRAYRRGAEHPDPEALETNDPLAESYAVARPRRLAAEEIRDAMLAVSGELQLAVGGIPVRPDMNLEAALQPRMIMGTFAPAYTPNPRPEDRNRRSLYVLRSRGHRDPFYETFNRPSSERSCELRDSSTVTPQALTLLNGEETNDRALALAARLLQDVPDDAVVIRKLYRLAYGREPDPAEADAARKHWKRMESVEAKIKHEPRVMPTKVVRRANEENTGEPFTFTERLSAYDEYVPDLQASDVDARTRGLANVCLAILNSNEFFYVY